MRTNSLLFTIFLMTSLACTKENLDDISPEPQEIGITGNWVLIKTITDDPLFDINGDGVNSKDLLEEMPCRFIKLSLNDDGTFRLKSNSWGYSGSSGAILCYGGTSATVGTWSVDENYTILSLLGMYEGEVFDMPEVPVEVTDTQLLCRLGILLFDHGKNDEQKQIFGISIFERQ